MDWNRVRTLGEAREAPPCELLETCWRFVGRSKRVLACGVYRGPRGLEVRAGYGPDDLMASHVAADLVVAREVAQEWRQAVLKKRRFKELERSGR